eukprot:c17899_g1_i2.p1 GENE.c17899_g1_i2~~c17899_g1_i2.p1  ORF type:complete len:184 (+),score=30.92 c17899_g1_i2:3-554(+)
MGEYMGTDEDRVKSLKSGLLRYRTANNSLRGLINPKWNKAHLFRLYEGSSLECFAPHDDGQPAKFGISLDTIRDVKLSRQKRFFTIIASTDVPGKKNRWVFKPQGSKHAVTQECESWVRLLRLCIFGSESADEYDALTGQPHESRLTRLFKRLLFFRRVHRSKLQGVNDKDFEPLVDRELIPD